MRGIVLAGGTGSRLGALTKCVNKHLLPVGGQPMIEWPLKVLRANGITDITIVSSPRGIGQLAEYLGSGYTYRVQDKPGGIVQAILCANTCSHENVVVILGDNIFLATPHLIEPLDNENCAVCFLKAVTPDRTKEFGVPTFIKERDRISYITEKPKKPDSYYAVTGLYVFTLNMFSRAKHLPSSERGEVEISSLLNLYARDGALDHVFVGDFWGDAGTIEGMMLCEQSVRAR